MSQSRKSLHRKKRKTKRLIAAGIGMFLLLYTVAWVVINQLNSTIGNTYKNIDTNDKRDGSQVMIDATQPISFALLGLDSRNGDDEEAAVRSDAIMIGTINPNTNQTTLVSVPRDTYALMDGYETEMGYNFYDKITHAYAFGQADMSINSLQELINIPIDYYVEVNMQGLIDIVDAMGGIEVTSPLTFDYEGNYFVEGETRTLNGTEALAFSRMRKTDPEGDFGRQKREKIVIEAIIDKALSFNSITNYQSILQTMEDNVKTNLTFKEITDLLAGYRGALENINKQDKLVGEELWLDDIYYLYVNPEERLKISNVLRKELELSEIVVEDLTLSETDLNYLYTYYYVDDYDETDEENNDYDDSYDGEDYNE